MLAFCSSRRWRGLCYSPHSAVSINSCCCLLMIYSCCTYDFYRLHKCDCSHSIANYLRMILDYICTFVDNFVCTWGRYHSMPQCYCSTDFSDVKPGRVHLEIGSHWLSLSRWYLGSSSSWRYLGPSSSRRYLDRSLNQQYLGAYSSRQYMDPYSYWLYLHTSLIQQ